jgi:hypothetical protein
MRNTFHTLCDYVIEAVGGERAGRLRRGSSVYHTRRRVRFGTLNTWPIV